MNTVEINRQNLIVIAKDFSNLTTQEIINKLKNEGVKVKVSHFRKNPDTGKEERYMRHERPFKPLPNKGYTKVSIQNNNTHYFGVSACYHKDTFSYKTGTRKALAKALHNFIKNID